MQNSLNRVKRSKQAHLRERLSLKNTYNNRTVYNPFINEKKYKPLKDEKVPYHDTTNYGGSTIFKIQNKMDRLQKMKQQQREYQNRRFLEN